MDAITTVTGVVDQVGQQVAAAQTALIPVGQALAASFVVLTIVMLGASLAAGGAGLIGPLVRMCAAGAGTYWAITYWPEITLGTLHAARGATGLLIGGYSGPATLFKMAGDVAGRVSVESDATARWYELTSMVRSVTEGLCAILVFLGLSVTGLLATLAELELLIGGAVAPLVLPALAFGLTSSIGFGPVQYMVSSGVRVVVMGTVSFVMAQAVTAVVTVPGTDAPLPSADVWAVLGVSLLTAIVGFSANGLARSIVGGSPGALGLGSTFGPAVAGLSLGSSAVRSLGPVDRAVSGAIDAAKGAASKGAAAVGSWSGGSGSGGGAGGSGGSGKVGVSSDRASAFDKAS